MNNFDTILFAILKECGNKKMMSGAGQFQKIASCVGLTVLRLNFYVDCLGELGLLKYDPQDRVITLTAKGEAANHAFSQAFNVPEIQDTVQGL